MSQLRNTQESYGSMAKFLHWSLAILILAMLIGGAFMSALPRSAKMIVYPLHKSTGLLILCLMLVRIYWVFTSTKPQSLTLTPWQRIAEHSAHGLLYIGFLVMPLSGWLMSTAANKIPVFYGLFTVPMPGIPESEMLKHLGKDIHNLTAYSMGGLLFLHIAAALKHHWCNQDKVLKRMLPG